MVIILQAALSSAAFPATLSTPLGVKEPFFVNDRQT
jgi:hypothetical protein